MLLYADYLFYTALGENSTNLCTRGKSRSLSPIEEVALAWPSYERGGGGGNLPLQKEKQEEKEMHFDVL